MNALNVFYNLPAIFLNPSWGAIGGAGAGALGGTFGSAAAAGSLIQHAALYGARRCLQKYREEPNTIPNYKDYILFDNDKIQAAKAEKIKYLVGAIALTILSLLGAALAILALGAITWLGVGIGASELHLAKELVTGLSGLSSGAVMTGGIFYTILLTKAALTVPKLRYVNGVLED